MPRGVGFFLFLGTKFAARFAAEVPTMCRLGPNGIDNDPAFPESRARNQRGARFTGRAGNSGRATATPTFETTQERRATMADQKEQHVEEMLQLSSREMAETQGGATTDVQFTLTVTDTQTSKPKTSKASCELMLY
jgi:hypothetical protein